MANFKEMEDFEKLIDDCAATLGINLQKKDLYDTKKNKIGREFSAKGKRPISIKSGDDYYVRKIERNVIEFFEIDRQNEASWPAPFTIWIASRHSSNKEKKRPLSYPEIYTPKRIEIPIRAGRPPVPTSSATTIQSAATMNSNTVSPIPPLKSLPTNRSTANGHMPPFEWVAWKIVGAYAKLSESDQKYLWVSIMDPKFDSSSETSRAHQSLLKTAKNAGLELTIEKIMSGLSLFMAASAETQKRFLLSFDRSLNDVEIGRKFSLSNVTVFLERTTLRSRMAAAMQDIQPRS